MPKKILLLSRYSRMGASSRIRFYQYVPYLAEHDLEITIAHLLGDDYLTEIYAGKPKNINIIARSYFRRLTYLLRSRQFDLLWIQAELFPWSPAWAERLLAAINVPYVVDYDDAVFHYYDIHSNPYVRAAFGHKIDTVMRKSALVIAGNEYLAQRAQKAGAPNVAILPSVVDATRYTPTSTRDREAFTIGWIGSPTTALFLTSCRHPLKTISLERNTRIILVGSGPLQLGKIPVEIQPWSEGTEAAAINQFDVGIMPMPDNPWTRGKCGYKLIQYMAGGIPVIASPVGVNNQIVEHGVNGLLAESTQEWIESLTILRDDIGLRHKMGMAGRAKMETEYSLQITAPRLLALLEQAINT